MEVVRKESHSVEFICNSSGNRMAGQQGNREIINLLAVLASGVFCAALIAYLFIANYGPSGQYLAGHTLLDPSVLEQVGVLKNDHSKGQMATSELDQFTFAYFDPIARTIKRLPVSRKTYAEFYKMTASELSISDGKGNVERLFLQSHPALLTANIRVENGAFPSKSTMFQTVELIPDDYFRVQLIQGGQEDEWAYFYLENSFKQALDLFNGPVQ